MKKLSNSKCLSCKQIIADFSEPHYHKACRLLVVEEKYRKIVADRKKAKLEVAKNGS